MSPCHTMITYKATRWQKGLMLAWLLTRKPRLLSCKRLRDKENEPMRSIVTRTPELGSGGPNSQFVSPFQVYHARLNDFGKSRNLVQIESQLLLAASEQHDESKPPI
jgi:hypothetical protein